MKGKENQMTFAINYYTLRLELGICPVLSESFDHRYIKAQLKSGSKPKPKSKLFTPPKKQKEWLNLPHDSCFTELKASLSRVSQTKSFIILIY